MATLEKDEEEARQILNEEENNDNNNCDVEERRTNPPSDPPPNRNVKLILLYTFLVFAGRSLWSQSTLSMLVFLLKGENAEAVGFITATMGISQLAVSFPIGHLADLWRRDTILRIASMVGCIAIGATLGALYLASFVCLTIALAMWGIYWGMANTCISALFADSIPQGWRSKYFTQRQVLLKWGTMVGPIVALILFHFLGNTWTLRDCSIVMMVGQGLSAPALFIICFLNDKHDHDNNNNGGETNNNTANNDSLNNDQDDEQRQMLREPLLLHHRTPTPPTPTTMESSRCESESNILSLTNAFDDLQERQEDQVALLASQQDNQTNCCRQQQQQGNESASETDITTSTQEATDSSSDGQQQWLCCKWFKCTCCCCSGISKQRLVPILIATADVISGLGSGMSIRYFPIFFAQNLSLSPVLIQIMYILPSIIQTILMHLGQRWSKRRGSRCFVVLVYKYTGIFCMAALIFSYSVLHLHVAILCTLYVIRTSFINSPTALTKSIVMDHVPRSERAKWSAIESLNMFSWSGSAFLGGILVGWKGIVFNFCITFLIQFLATIPILLALPHEMGEGQHRQQHHQRQLEQQQQQSSNNDESDDDADDGALVVPPSSVVVDRQQCDKRHNAV